MDRFNKKPGPGISLAIAIGIVYGLLSFLNISDPFSLLLRPLVTGVINLLGIPGSNDGDYLLVGKLVIPWTRDCAGINLLLFLWALLVWINRHKLTTGGFWMRFALAVPVAFLANFSRIITLIVYRWLAFPATESPAMHYLIGFLWILPFLKPLTGFKKESANDLGFLEAVYVMAVLALAAAYIGTPGGHLVLLGSLVLLAETQSLTVSSLRRWWVVVIWIGIGLLIGISGMESLWIPFLLMCPLINEVQRWRSPGTYGALLATIPLVGMNVFMQWILLVLIAIKVWQLVRAASVSREAPSVSPVTVWRPAMLVLATLMPFLMPLFGWRSQTSWRPAPAQIVSQLDANSYQLKVLVQPPDLRIFGYLPSGDGRHHTLEVCMRYRGIQLEQASGEVMTDGQSWMKQYFFQEGLLTADYATYVKRTFAPFSEAGVHIIAIAPIGGMDRDFFESAADDAVKRLIEP